MFPMPSLFLAHKNKVNEHLYSLGNQSGLSLGCSRG